MPAITSTTLVSFVNKRALCNSGKYKKCSYRYINCSYRCINCSCGLRGTLRPRTAVEPRVFPSDFSASKREERHDKCQAGDIPAHSCGYPSSLKTRCSKIRLCMPTHPFVSKKKHRNHSSASSRKSPTSDVIEVTACVLNKRSIRQRRFSAHLLEDKHYTVARLTVCPHVRLKQRAVIFTATIRLLIQFAGVVVLVGTQFKRHVLPPHHRPLLLGCSAAAGRSTAKPHSSQTTKVVSTSLSQEAFCVALPTPFLKKIEPMSRMPSLFVPRSSTAMKRPSCDQVGLQIRFCGELHKPQ